MLSTLLLSATQRKKIRNLLADMESSSLKRMLWKIGSSMKRGYLRIKEVWAFRELLFFLAWRDLRILYKQTTLGFGWIVIKPFFSMIVFSIVFGRLAKLSSDGIPYPLFVFSALVPWYYFSATVCSSGMSLVANANLITKVYFPRLILPVVPLLSNVVSFVVSGLFLIGMMIYYKTYPSWNIVFFPLLFFIMVLTILGMGLWLSALGTKYRDVAQAMQFIMSIMMYAAPVVYPLSMVPEKYRFLYGMFPMVGVVEGFRVCLFNAGEMPWGIITLGTAVSVVVVCSGVLYYDRKEKYFSDVV